MDFNDPAYDRLETDPSYTHDLPSPVVSAYRMRLQLLRAAANERDLTSMRMLGLAALDNSPRAYSIPLTDGYALTLDVKTRSPRTCALIRSVVRPESDK